MTKFVHEQVEDALKALDRTATNADIAECIADYYLCAQRYPLRLAINHNAKAAPCPIRIDKGGLKSSSVTMANAAEARTWIIDALMRGYEVQCPTWTGGIGYRSIAGERQQIEGRARMTEYREKVASGEIDDDEIPF